jgi:predicted TIM-barrel fold metal-dependent hydrolase
VVFPNTVPPFFPSFVLFAKPPTDDEYEHRHAGVQAHNRWLKDWCDEFPERRFGVGQVFTNDIDDTLADIKWIKENLRGGLLLPNTPPNSGLRPLYDPELDPVWELCQDLEIPVHVHGGTGNPDYGPYAVSMLLYIMETPFYSQRPFVQLLLSGVFERFPRLKFVMTEQGCSWVPGLLAHLDDMLEGIRSTGATGEIRYGSDHVLPRSATEYFNQNVWMSVSQPRPADIATRDAIGVDRFMWGSDYPHDEGTYPYTREHLRSRFAGVDPSTVRKLLSENAAELYGFDLEKLAPLAAKFGPTVEEISTPIDAVPEKELQRLSDDMDPKAIK